MDRGLGWFDPPKGDGSSAVTSFLLTDESRLRFWIGFPHLVKVFFRKSSWFSRNLPRQKNLSEPEHFCLSLFSLVNSRTHRIQNATSRSAPSAVPETQSIWRRHVWTEARTTNDEKRKRHTDSIQYAIYCNDMYITYCYNRMEWLHTYHECIYIWCIRILYIVWTCVQYTCINLDKSQFKKWSKADKLEAHSKRFKMRKQLGKERQLWVQTVKAVKALWKCLSPMLKMLEIARQVCETVSPKNPKRNGGCRMIMNE